jgi:hypothetical protein
MVLAYIQHKPILEHYNNQIRLTSLSIEILNIWLGPSGNQYWNNGVIMWAHATIQYWDVGIIMWANGESISGRRKALSAY